MRRCEGARVRGARCEVRGAKTIGDTAARRQRDGAARARLQSHPRHEHRRHPAPHGSDQGVVAAILLPSAAVSGVLHDQDPFRASALGLRTYRCPGDDGIVSVAAARRLRRSQIRRKRRTSRASSTRIGIIHPARAIAGGGAAGTIADRRSDDRGHPGGDPAARADIDAGGSALSVGIMFFGRPFFEPTLLRIASAYEATTKHRIPPPDFGPVTEP